MRLIDADELMEHIGRDRLDSREAIMKMVKNAPTIQPEQRWIPVTDRLPETSEYYLVTVDTGLKPVDVVFFNNGSGFLMANTVTAWMPKPEPYRESNSK